MTRDELIERILTEVRLLECVSRTDYANGSLEAYRHALHVMRQLDSPPAMTWQDEPTHDCEAFVEGVDGVRRVVKRMGDWWYSSGSSLYLLGDRFVCPITAPPALPKRGAVDLAKHCEEAAKIVATWPAWKRGVLGHSIEPTNSVPRSPVDNQSNRLKRGEA